MNAETQDCAYNYKDSISLLDVADFLMRSWHWWVAGMLIGVASAWGFLLVTPAQYEAIAVIQPATVGIPNGANALAPFVIEPPEKTLERLKLVPFYNEALVKACEAPSAAALMAGVKAAPVKNNALIQISYRGSSPQRAGICVEAVVNRITQSQAELGAPLINSLQEQLILTKQQLVEAERFQAKIEGRAIGISESNWSSSLMVLNALSKRDDVALLQKSLIQLRAQLSEPMTQPTRLLEPIYAPERAVFPKKSLTILSGLIGGLISGVGLACLVYFVRRAWFTRRFCSIDT